MVDRDMISCVIRGETNKRALNIETKVDYIALVKNKRLFNTK